MADEARPTTGPVKVGYALRDKRISSFMLPELLRHATSRQVDFSKVDTNVPLEEQGPFDMILHKIDTDVWANNLKSYAKAHTEVVIVDDYDAVHKLDDRRVMLQAVEQLDVDKLGAQILVPKQLIIEASVKPQDIAGILEKEGLQLPAVSKPTAANGTHSSHSLCLVLTKDSLQHLEPPVILQEFVNHGGVLFKLYILGDKVMVFRRHSLPDITTSETAAADAQQVVSALEKRAQEDIPGLVGDKQVESPKDKQTGLVELNRISNVHLSAEELQDGRVTDPAPELMRELGLELKQLLGLHAFNVDILREDGHGAKYYIVDINYMPGYERMPDFAQLFVDFVITRVAARREAMSSGKSVEAEGLIKEELRCPVTIPQQPYPVLQGKKKWVYFRAAMKLCGLEHRNKGTSGDMDKE